MEQTIYSKYSNERAKKFCIRTDIVIDESGQKKVYKYALTKAAESHIRHIETAYEKLSAAYAKSRIRFCPAKTQVLDESGTRTAPAGMRVLDESGTRTAAAGDTDATDRVCRSASPFLAGTSLQDVLEQLLEKGDAEGIEHLLKRYIGRIRESGGSRPFTMTSEFARVFGEAVPDGVYDSADVSDIDMIFSNIFVEEGTDVKADGEWAVIDYEWTFDFPIPKAFLIYRAFYFAYHQIFCRYDKSLEELLTLTGITPEEAKGFRKMEEKFQEYLDKGSFPVRNMQRLMGTRSIPFSELLKGQGTAAGNAGENTQSVPRRVRKLLYHVDRNEYQDGCVVCSGWALAKTWDGRCLPVEICVLDRDGGRIPAEIRRRKREDVAQTLKIRNVADSGWGFDCVWPASPTDEWSIHFSLGNRESIYEG